MKLRRSNIARLTPSSGSIFEKGFITSNRTSATRGAAPGASCVWTKPAGAATAVHCLDFGRPINVANDFNSDLEKVRDRYLQENRSGRYTPSPLFGSACHHCLPQDLKNDGSRPTKQQHAVHRRHWPK